MTVRRSRFHPEALAEFENAAAWYEERKAGLGGEFVDAIQRRIADVLDAPRLWRVVRRATRRAPVGRFPYAVVYREVSDTEIEIVAIAHLSRRPAYWGSRARS